MDSYQTFVQTFQQAVSTRNFSDLLDILKKNGYTSLAIVSLEHRESIVCSIFDRNNGLLYFLNYELAHRTQNQMCKNKSVDDALIEAFNFLTFFINNFYTTPCFVQYIHNIKDVCQLGLNVKHCYIEKAAHNTFMKLIELFKDHDLKFDEIVHNFCWTFHKYNVKEKKFIFCVLGKIIKHVESVRSLQKDLDVIFEQLYHDARKEYDSGIIVRNDFCMYFDALSDILDGMEPLNVLKDKQLSDSYKWIKDFSQSNKQQGADQEKVRTVMKSTINFLCRHMNLFQDLLYPDCMYWHDILQRLSLKTTTYGICGQRTLKRFYKIIGQILTNQNSDESEILVKFMYYFYKEFEKTNLDLISLRLLVYGFSQMAAPCKVHMTQFKVRHMYSITTSYALPLCSSEHSHSTHIESICCYQEALSEILRHMTDVTIENINILIKLSIYVIKRFPDLAISNNALAISTLTKTISNLVIVDKDLLQRYLDSIVYDGIAWSCSHTLALDAELQRELNNLKQSPIYYKNYLPLWTELLNAERYRGQEQLSQHVANTIIDVCITLINRLNINVKRRNEDTVLSDVALTQSAVNQADFRVFVNIVDLYVDVIDASESQLFANTVHRFLYEVIRLSYKYPLISGFYKLIRTGMKVFTHTLEDEEEKSAESRRVEELLSNYLWHTLDLIPAFSNELLIACLYFILDAPFAYVKDMLSRTLPAFKIAFTVGLSNLELAYTALIALEIWTTKAQEQKRDKQINKLLREIIVYLEPYLRSTESSVEVSQDLMAARKRVKRVEVINTDHTLRNYQRRVLLFLGSLDHDILTSFVHEHASRNTGASWDYKELSKVCKYSMFLGDAELVIHFDRMLPRIIALARDSSDRRTKIAACEVLHSMIAIIIGSLLKYPDSETRFPTLYSTLCQAVLALGCDSDEVVCGLFHPLALQLMRFWSSSLESMSLVIDSLFDSLTNDSNPALREFSGMCLAEFMRWSIRQSTTNRMEHHVRTIIKKINNLALHPLTRKRIAAAVAFNHLYVILREEDNIVSIHWLEIFYCFVRSLEGCDDPSITNALAHIERVMKVKAESLKMSNSQRRKPHEFDNATLTYALYWLLSQCGNLDENCRVQCMELYVNVSQHIDSSAQETTQNFVHTYGIKRLNNIILKGLESSVKDISVASNMTPLLKALDYYMWLINKELLPVEKLFPANDINEQQIFLNIRSFAYQFWRIIKESSMGTVAITMKSKELEQLQALQCKVLMTTLNFIQVLLNVNVNVPESLWDESLSALTIRCIMHPRTLGFDVKNIKMTDKLPHVLETLLNSMRLRYNYALPDFFNKCLSNFIREIVTKFLDLQDIRNDSCDDLIQHVNGLILLKRCDMLNLTMLETSAFTNADYTIEQIFKFLVSECIGEWACKDLSMQMIEYLRALMEFQFSLLSATIETPMIIPDDVRSIIDILMQLMSNSTVVTSVDCTIITHGEHFLNTFRNVIFKYMLTHVSAIMYVFEKSCDNPSFLLKWIEDMLLFLKQHRRERQAHMDTVVDSILQRFTYLKSIVFNVDSRKERLINIYSIAVHLKSKPTEVLHNHEFYQWILDELTNNNNLEYKTKILKSFFVCLTDDVADRNDLQISRTLRNNSRFLCSNLSEMSVNAMKVIDCFETLLVLLSTTRSKTMLKYVIDFAAGTGNRLFDEKLEEHLRGYYYGASLEHVLDSLQKTYSAFMEMNITETERLDILHGFLLPAFKFCDSAAIESFFDYNYKVLYDYYIDFLNISNDDAIKQKIVTMIGYSQLLTIMFARVDKNKIQANQTTIQNPGSNTSILVKRNDYQQLGQITKKMQMKIRKFRWSVCQKLVRQLQCSLYNCLLAIISLKEDEYCYRIVFSEPYVWEDIIDCRTQYELDQIFKEYPKTHEITVNIRSAEVESEERQTHRYTYVHSYDLSACTLSEDINAYDLNKCVVLPADFHRSASTMNSADSDPLRTHNATSITLTSNDFDKHECMPYICVILRHIRKVFVSTNTEPKWLTCFLNAMQRDNLHANIQLFMLKIISNTADEVFKPYAKFALTRIIKTIANYLQGNNLNYIITDILEILMDWHNVAIPNDEDGKAETQRLFERFIDKVFKRKSNDKDRIYNYNLNLLRTMVEKWRSCLRIPSDFLNQQITSASPAAVYLILVFLDNNMTEEIVIRDDIVNFLLKPLKNWDTPNSDKTPLHCCKCLGLYLCFLDNNYRDEIERDNKKRVVKEQIFNILGSWVFQKYIDKQVERVAVLCQTYPEVAQDYLKVAIRAMSTTKYPTKCLEIFALAIPRLDIKDVVTNLYHIGLQKILKTRMSSCEKIALRIVRDVVNILPMQDLPPYKQVISYIKDNITEHRELVYDILMEIHKRCSADTTVDNNAIVQDLLSVSKRNLVAGLLDPSPDLQDRILEFWTKEMKLDTKNLKDRLVSPLTMPSARLITEEDAFAPFVALLMLQQATKSILYTKKIFDEPLPNSSRFEEYKIAVSWRRRNLSCVTPMFVDSLASQISYSIFSQSVDNDLSGICITPTFSYPRLLQGLRATQDLQFEPTLDDDDDAADAATTFDISSHDTGFDRTIIASSSRQSLRTAGRERFTRILANTSNTTNFRNAQIQRNLQREERIQQENIRQRSSVKLYRNYRIGELPDIEITHKSFIVPLQQLVKLDRLICKDVIVSLFCSLTKETINQENIRQIIVDNLKQILHDSCKKDSSFNAVILETLLKLTQDAATVVNCDPQDVMKASKANHLNALGILLLEHSLLPDAQKDDSSPTSSKRMRLHDDAIRYEEINKWVQLASLYKSLNDVDVVLSIFRGQQFFGQNVQEAALAEVNGDWIQAKNAFTKAYEETSDPSIKEHCLQGLLEAVNNLCDWSAIDKFVKSHARNTNLRNIWNDAWKDWIIPYACDAYVHMISEETDLESSDMEAIQSWIYNREKLQHLMPLTGENLVIFLLNKDVTKATDLLNDLLDMTGKQWVGLNPLCTELRIRKLFKLQIMNNLDASLKILRCTNRAEYLNRTIALLNLWSMKTTTIRDNLIQWNKLVANRAYSSILFQNKCRKLEMTKRCYQINYQLRLDIINAALNNKHRYIAEKHLNYISEVFPEEYVSYRDLVWFKARLKSLFADVETDIFKKMSDYTTSWKNSHRLLNENCKLDADMSNVIREHISTMASKIEFLSREDQEFTIALKCKTTILRDIGKVGDREEISAVPGIPVGDLDKIRKHLLDYSLKKLQSCCEDTTTANIGKHYCALAKHCYGRLMSTDVESDEIFQEFLLSTLKSMYHDCLEATHYFPCLLRSERLQNDETRERFVRECNELRPWLFLRWQDLLFSHLGTSSISIAIMPIIEKLAKTYPDAIIYNYYLTVERNPSILENVNIQRIRSLLHDKAEEYERFLRAMQYVVQPKLYLKHFLDKAMKDLSPGNTTEIIESLLQKVYPNSSTGIIEGKNPRPGAIFTNCEEMKKYESDIKSLNSNDDLEAVRKGMAKLKESLIRSIQRQNNRNNRKGSTSELNNYSPFLYEYVDGGIEIPGQYTGDREPIPRYHVRIARFEPQVEVMQSLRKPIRISMIGNNGKEYKFLVKFGEDLTIDRGLQQLYSTMNRTLHNDPGCRQRRLAIDTYEVIPLSSSFGLIQWIENTRSLDELICLTLSDNETDRCKKIVKEYAEWIQKAAPEKRLIPDCYIEAVSKYNQQTVTKKMNYLIRETKQTALREAFDAISQSPECFVTLRRNFIISYATMCVAHWLAGIGDRHLQNTLVHVATGRCLGIDFGYAFGSGIRASVPELVPFRLTPQILELLRPFTERDLLATIMNHTMQALRDDQGPILACTDIFVHKPVQWNINDDEIMKNSDENIDADLIWSKKNIEIVAKKLNGIHPSIITLEQLKEVQSSKALRAIDNRHFAKYDAIVSGNDEIKQARADIKKDHLTTVEQVDCLLDQAKDLNILGRMYQNWRPWL